MDNTDNSPASEAAWEGGFTDIPVRSPDVAASAPSPEEMRTAHNQIRRPRRSCDKFVWLGLLLFAIVLSLLIVMAVNVGGETDDEPPSGNEDLDLRQSDVDKVITFMALEGISDLTALEQSGTPQNVAATWIAEQDEADLAVPTVEATAVDRYKYITRYVMAVLYFFTGGGSWENQIGFMTKKDVCDWNLRFFNGYTYYRKGVICDDISSRVYSILLESNNLVGTLPRELGALTTLQMLAFDNNFAIGGQLPDEICRLSQLRSFEATYNKLVGHVPTCIDQLSDLQLLFLSNNDMTGPLPEALGTLVELQGILLDDNEFTGDVTNLFNNLPKLEWLHLEANTFEGIITDDFLASQTELIQLDLSSNNFEGSLPAHFFFKPNLEFLDLNDNFLTNSIPAIVAENNELIFLSVHDNDMTGPLPLTLANLRELKHLDVSSNDFNGNFPAEIGTMVNLEYFMASANNFTPDFIPEFFGDLFKLEELGLKSTSRVGGIPAFLGDLKDLILLDLDNNMLSGPLPTELAKLTDLEFLLLNRNELSGDIPIEFSALTSLRLALLDRNDLHGSMAHMCDLPNFLEPSRDSDGTEFLIADCIGDNPKIDCKCCKICCSDLNPNCHEYTAIPNIDPKWEYNFNRLEFKFGNETSFFVSDILQ